MPSVELAPYEQASLLFFRTLTPLHVGIGRAVGVVDLPVERDGLGLPTIPPSGVKGAIREHFRHDKLETYLFGPRQEEELHAGAFTILSTHLVAMPARSLKGVWALVTAPLALRRLRKWAQLADAKAVTNEVDAVLKKLEEDMLQLDEVGVASKAVVKLAIGNEIVLNEEFRFRAKPIDVLDALAQRLIPDEAWRLIVAHDDLFKPVVERSLLRRARIRLKPETKTVEAGGLWTEEDVPANAVFTTVFLYSKLRAPKERVERLEGEIRGRAEEMREKADEVRKYIEEKLLPDGRRGYLILGGHETIGRGLVEVVKVV